VFLYRSRVALIGLGEVLKALEAFSTSIDLNPNWIYSYLGRGHAYADRGEKEKAKKDFDKVLSIDPTNQQAKDALASLQVDSPTLEDARLYLDDAKQFVSELNQAPASISQIAAAAAELEIALIGFNDGATLQARVHLTDLLVPLTGFQEFLKRRQEDRGRATRDRLVEASEESVKKPGQRVEVNGASAPVFPSGIAGPKPRTCGGA
jgi:tetratricopeptide (TPR) repeat protein